MDYHKKEVNEVLEELGSSLSGLTSEEANRRLLKYGKNTIEEKKRNVFLMFLANFKDIMLLILFFSFLISLFLKEYSDAFIILGVIILNAILSFIQEYKAEKAVENLKKLAKPEVICKRDNKLIKIKSEDVTIGDIIYIETGDILNFDLRIIESFNLKMDESSLTGESLAVNKYSEVRKNVYDESLYSSIAFTGTSVIYGHGIGIVINKVQDSQLGKIAQSLNINSNELTPMQKSLKKLAKRLTLLVVIIMVIILLIGLIQKNSFFEMLLLSLSIGVAAIPEGMVATITISLALGVKRLAKKNALVRKMSSIETLGCSDIIATDKTGTITENKMKVKELYINGLNYDEKEELNTFSYNNVFFLIMSLCNSLKIDESKIIGDPTEKALYEYAYQNGYIKDDILKAYKYVDEIPFDSARKMMTCVYQKENKYYSFVKGALEVIIDKCEFILKNGVIRSLTKDDKNSIIAASLIKEEKAYRLLALAYKEAQKEKFNYEENLIFVGLVAMQDAPKEGVKESIKECKEAGIRTLMITGDTYSTSYKIAKEVKIITRNDEAMSQKELDKLSDDKLKKIINKYNLFYRITPEGKKRIIQTLKAKGKVVAMIGDGVNDAPSLKIADIGVGMGEGGSDVSKSASDIILKDDNFSSLVSAIKEGRRIYANIKKSILYLLSCNLGEVFVVLISTLLGSKILLPIHILYMNLITDSLPSLALASEDYEKEIMKEKPRDKKEAILNKEGFINIFYQGILQGLLSLLSFYIGKTFFNLVIGETMAFVTIVFIQLFHSLNMRSFTNSLFHLKPNYYLYASIIVSISLQLLIIYVAPFNKIFKVSPLPFALLLISLFLAFLIIPIMELCKLLLGEIKKENKKN